MITLYHNKRKGTFNQMRIDELYQCINCLYLDKSKIQGTGSKDRILKNDLINYLKIYVKDKEEFGDKLAQICIELTGSTQKYWVDHKDFLSYFPGICTLIFKTIPNGEYCEIIELGWKNKFVCSKKHHKSEKEFDLLVKCTTFLETRQLYVKIKQFCVNDLLIDVIRYCMLFYCDLLGNDLVRNITII